MLLQPLESPGKHLRAEGFHVLVEDNMATFTLLSLEEFLPFSQEKKHTLQNNLPLGIVTNTESYLSHDILHTASQFIKRLMGWKWRALDVLSKNISTQVVYSDSETVLAAKKFCFHTCFQIYLNQNKTQLGSIKDGLGDSSHHKTELAC